MTDKSDLPYPFVDYGAAGIWPRGSSQSMLLEMLKRFRDAQGTEARRAETGTGSVHDGPVPEGDAP